VARNQRQRIVAAVAEATAAKGYARMSVEDVVRGAGVSRRTFYELFPNKDAVFLEAYDQVANLLLAGVRAAYEEESGFAARMTAGFRAFLELLEASPAFARMCVVEVMAAGPEAVKRRNAAMRAFAQMIEENARQRLAKPPPSELTAETVVGGIYDVVFTRIQRGDVRVLPELAPQLVHTALVHYLGPEAAASSDGTGAMPGPAREAPGAA
jgi:AcrR family transcriptional regulator